MEGWLYNRNFQVKAKCMCIGVKVGGDGMYIIFETLDFNYGMK